MSLKAAVSGGHTSVGDTWRYLTDGANWSGGSGFAHLIVQHIGYSVEVLVIAAAVALPVGLVTGHTRRGGAAVSMIGDVSRALPTLGLLVLLAIELGLGFVDAALLPLLLLAIPTMLVNTYVGIEGVDRQLVDAAVGMGLRPLQVLVRVEIPVALPILLLGLRTAVIQVVSTVTIAAAVGLGGLGRPIFDGEASNDLTEVLAGAVVVAVFAIAVEGLLLLLERLAVSPGVRARTRTA